MGPENNPLSATELASQREVGIGIGHGGISDSHSLRLTDKDKEP